MLSAFTHSLRMNIWVQNGEGIQGLTKCDRRTPSSILIQPSPPHGYQTIAPREEMGGGGNHKEIFQLLQLRRRRKKQAGSPQLGVTSMSLTRLGFACPPLGVKSLEQSLVLHISGSAVSCLIQAWQYIIEKAVMLF